MKYDRAEKGLQLARLNKVTRISKPEEEIYEVASGSTIYIVTLDTSNGSYECTCPDFQHKNIACKHIIAVFITRNSE